MKNRLDGVIVKGMVRIVCGSTDRVEHNFIELVFAASPLNSSKENNKDRFAPSKDNVSEWSDMSTCRLSFHCTSTTKIQQYVGLVQSRYHHHYHHLISCSSYIRCNSNIVYFVLNNNYSLSHHTNIICFVMYVCLVYQYISRNNNFTVVKFVTR